MKRAQTFFECNYSIDLSRAHIVLQMAQLVFDLRNAERRGWWNSTVQGEANTEMILLQHNLGLDAKDFSTALSNFYRSYNTMLPTTDGDDVLNEEDKKFFMELAGLELYKSYDEYGSKSKETVKELLIKADSLAEAHGDFIETLDDFFEKFCVELDFARRELEHYEKVKMILAAISTPGFTGEPGNLLSQNIETSDLADLVTSFESGNLELDTKLLRALYRDALLLFKAREARKNAEWDELMNVLSERSSIEAAYESSEGIESVNIMYRVHTELHLLHGDLMFMACLMDFQSIMETNSCVVLEIEELLNLLLRCQESAKHSPGNEIKSLIESVQFAIDICSHYTFNSPISRSLPRELIKKMLDSHTWCLSNSATPYVSLILKYLFRDAANFSEILITEITSGQAYLDCQVGEIDPDLATPTELKNFLDAIIPINTLHGIDSNEELLRWANVIANMRSLAASSSWSELEVLAQRNFVSIVNVFPSVLKELSRLLCEAQNRTSIEEIAGALSNGKLLDVREIAKMLSPSHKKSCISETSKKSRRQSSVQVLSTFKFEVGIEALTVALENSMRVTLKSERLEVLIEDAKVISRLRRSITENDIRSFEQAILEGVHCSELIESELNAAEHGLNYVTTMYTISKALMQGTVEGNVGNLVVRRINHTQLELALSQLNSLKFRDTSTEILSRICEKSMKLRQCVKASRWVAINSVNMEDTVDFVLRDFTDFQELLRTMEGILNPPSDINHREMVDASVTELDWIDLQWKALTCVKREVLLISQELQDRKTRRFFFQILRNIPKNISDLSNKREEDFYRGTRLEDDTFFAFLDIEESLEILARAKEILTELSEDTRKVLKTTELVVSFRREMLNEIALDKFKDSLILQQKNLDMAIFQLKAL